MDNENNNGYFDYTNPPSNDQNDQNAGSNQGDGNEYRGGYYQAPPPSRGGYIPPQPPLQNPSSGMATASMILGLLGIFCCGFFASVPAIVLAILDRSKRGRFDGMALVGLVCGISAWCFPLSAPCSTP